jgi:hypothetical protein
MRQSYLQGAFQTNALFKAALIALNNGPLQVAEIVIIRVKRYLDLVVGLRYR